MTGVYLLSAILGIGLLIFSSLGGGDGGDGTDLLDVESGNAGQILLGLFSTRNLTFFLAAFGAAGLMLTWLGTPPFTTSVIATLLGAASMALAHSIFSWLKRTDSAVDVLGDRDFEGTLARVVLPVSATERGQVACIIAGREVYLTARLVENSTAPLLPGEEAIILHADGGVVTVMPATQIDLLPPS